MDRSPPTCTFAINELLDPSTYLLTISPLCTLSTCPARTGSSYRHFLHKFTMHALTIFPFLLLPFAVSSSLPSPQHIFANPPESSKSGFRVPTVHESAVQARRILHLSSIATLSTVFPSSHAPSPNGLSALENRPIGLGGMPVGLMDYYADCEPGSGNPTILAIGIATSFKNVDAGSNITLSLRWHPPPHHRPSPDPYKFSPANLPRFSLVGHLETISARTVKDQEIAKCFTKKHADAEAWLPGNKIHESYWVRLIVEDVYWIGGFGDRAYIGWIPVDEWRNVTVRELQEIRLPGEKENKARSGWWEAVGRKELDLR